MDFTEVSPNAKSSTRNEPNYASLWKIAPIKKEQINKANAILKLTKLPKYASSVLATLCSMGLVMMKPVNVSSEPNTSSFFCLFAESHPEFIDEPQDQQHACLRNKLISFISTYEMEFTKVYITV